MITECWKVTFETKGDAEKQAGVLNQQMRQRKKLKGHLTAYRCQNCSKFHLTSEKRR